MVIHVSPELIVRARALYETRDIPFHKLGAQLGVDYPQLHQLATVQGWQKFADVVARLCEQVETEIMSVTLKVGAGRPVNGKKPFVKPRKAPGRPRVYQRERNEDPQTEKQALMRQARELYEAGKGTKTSIAKLLGINPEQVFHAAKVGGWVDPRLAKARAEQGPAVPANSYVVIPPPSLDAAKAQMEIAISGIRGRMTGAQIRQLDGFESLVSKFGHLLEVYLDPHSFVDKNLPPDEYATQVVQVQKTALQLIAPTKMDSLQGGLKIFGDALMRSIELKRAIVGLNKIPALADGTAENDATAKQLFDVDALSTDELRVVQRGMELLDNHQRRGREVPMPPRPASIDDLMGPDAQVVKEPEVTR
jgi:hypothetical protein